MSPLAGQVGAASPTLPKTTAAQNAARWLGGQLTPQGTIDDVTPGTADLSETLQAVLALGAAGVDLHAARAGLSYLEARSAGYITQQGSDGPGQLANLILAAHVLGASPTDFGGTNLVTRLLATEQASGPDAGRFGTDAQNADYNAGTLDQGLALAALAAVGVQPPAAAVRWLVNQQCPNGGWTDPDDVTNPCDPDPIGSAVPDEDTNTTSYVLEGLAAQGALTSAVSTKALSFLTAAQDSDGGWGYSPNTAANPETSDPDSTALVIQALLASGQSPGSSTYDKGADTPLSALLSFEVTSGPDAGAFSYPGVGSATTGNLLATDQAAPALAGLTLPYPPASKGGSSYWVFTAKGAVSSFGGAASHGAPTVALRQPIVGVAPTPDGGGYWLAAADGGVFTFGDAAFYGSLGGKLLDKPVVGIAATPDGGGYWLVASDGGVFSFGDAAFYGSLGGKALDKPVVAIAPDPDGGGYWLVGADGGVFTFGDAAFFGSTGGIKLNEPVVGISPSPDGGGYWLVAADGGIFNFGDAAFSGSAADSGVSNIVAVATSST